MARFHALIHASEVLTGAGIRKKDGRRPLENDTGRIPDGAVVYSLRKAGGKELPGKVEWVGPTGELPSRFSRTRKTDLRGRKAVVPGLIDCHTHVVFAGDRSEEFALRCGGASYEEIAARGGGILTTMRSTREASVAELERLAVPRVKEAWHFGVRTLEIKSGYGLDVESELKTLEVIARLKRRFPRMTIQSTFLGAHALPPDIPREEYIRQILDEMLPEVARRGLADACDVFVDRGYYTLEEGRRILDRARKLGLKTKIHADELANTESTAMAAELGALSADHLLKISDKGIEALARSRKTVGVILPGTAFYLKEAHAPARKLIDAGAAVAVSTDFNPGSCACNSLPAIMTISALYLGMTKAELLAAVTYNAAKALGLEKSKGSIEPGKDADLTVLPFRKFEEIYYRFAPGRLT